MAQVPTASGRDRPKGMWFEIRNMTDLFFQRRTLDSGQETSCTSASCTVESVSSFVFGWLRKDSVKANVAPMAAIEYCESESNKIVNRNKEHTKKPNRCPLSS
jgi:hypothetical protein